MSGKSTRREATSVGLTGHAAVADGGRRDRHAVRIVGVDDLRLDLLEDAGQPPRRREIELRARRQADEVEAFRGAAPQLALRMRHQHGAVAEAAQAEHRQQRLVLAAPPGPRRVDVQREHRVSSYPAGRRRRSHSLASFRKTYQLFIADTTRPAAPAVKPRRRT